MSTPVLPEAAAAGVKPPDARPMTRCTTAHLVGYAHLDPVWLWTWEEGYAEARATLLSAADRLDEYPEFAFTTTSVQFLAWVAEADPELFDRLAARIAEGRLHLAGGWWVEPDCNLPSGESLARHGLYGQRWLAEHVGVIATVGANPDSFGHPVTLPQIVRGAGMTGYVFTRPSEEELALPAPEFRWRGLDGSEIVACRTFGYSSDRDALAELVDRNLRRQPGARQVLVFFGVGNHGGGPTRANLDSLRRLGATRSDVDILCSTPAAFFESLESADLAVHVGELQHHSRGCYAAHAGIKAWNRRVESALAVAERWALAAAHLTGLDYPGDELRRGWRQLLLNQFHDTLAGTAIESAYDDARNQLGEALAIASRVTNVACGRLAARADVPAAPDVQPIVVFNPHPWPLHTIVEHEVGGWARRMNLRDDAGAPVALQWGESEATMREGRYRAVFPVDVPAMGMRVYRLGVGPCAVPTPEPVPGVDLDNGIVSARIDRATGGLASLRLAGGPELAGTGGHAVVHRDATDTWGHELQGYGDIAGQFDVVAVEGIEHGPARTVVRVTSQWRSSTLVEHWSLGAGDSYVDLAVTLDWREQCHALKLRFPTRVRADAVEAEVAYGAVQRPADGSEEPMQRFVDVHGTVDGRAGGVAVANDAKYAYDARPGPEGVDVGITVARSVVYAHHDPAVLTEGAAYRRHDLGEQRFRLRIVPHTVPRAVAEVERRAIELNERPHVRRDTYHEGALGGSASFASVEGRHVVLGALKRAEDGSGDVVRLAETAGTPASAVVTLAYRARRFAVELRPWQIATFLVPDDPDQDVRAVDLCEWSDGERPPGQAAWASPTLLPGAR